MKPLDRFQTICDVIAVACAFFFAALWWVVAK